MENTVLLIATFDTKAQEALYLKQCIEAQGVRVLVMDTGILGSPHTEECILREEVARRGGMALEEAVATKDKRVCTEVMCRGCETITRELYDEGRIQAAIALGDDHAFICLQTLAVAFLDFHLNDDGVAGGKLGDRLVQTGHFFFFELGDEIHRHSFHVVGVRGLRGDMHAISK